ncbi:MAG: branched chain amino acid aminotransferase [Phycisphaerae bacterium]
MSVMIPEPLSARKNSMAPREDLKIWIDGELLPPSEAKISVFDHGLLYGDGIFEGIRVYNGRIFKEREHLRRFGESAKAIRLELPLPLEGIGEAMHETLRANNITGDAYIRLLCTRGVGKLGISIYKAACPSLIVIADKIELYPPDVYQRGLKCITSSSIRVPPHALSPRIKSLNYLNNVLAKAEANDAGADEAILLNHLGQISECTGDNLFLVKNNRLATPPTSAGILDGITRAVVMELARRRNLPVDEKALIQFDLYVADEIFATGTAAEIVPVTSVDRRVVGDGKPGPITRQLMQDFVTYRNAEGG